MKISIVTPSFERCEFLEETMRSVLDQGYHPLEYVVVDGGSVDGSAELVRRYADRLAWSVSEKDNGQFDAINKGFARTTGEVMAWINSDDKLCPWSLDVVSEIFATLPEVEWLTTVALIRWDRKGRAVRCLPQRGYSRKGFLAGENLPNAGHFSTGWIQQESTFWRRSLWERAGGHVRADLHCAGDFELWTRFFRHAELYGVEVPLGGFRVHGEQKTGAGLDTYWSEAEPVFKAAGGRRYGPFRSIARRLARQSCPGFLRSLACRAGLLHRVKLCRHNRRSDQWQIVESWN